jgi:hypothetical protein
VMHWHLHCQMPSTTWCWRLSHPHTCPTKSEWAHDACVGGGRTGARGAVGGNWHCLVARAERLSAGEATHRHA